MSVLEYQQRIQSRIAAHADRVASAQLGAAELVRQDIENAMALVWALLPEGYGPKMRDDDEGDSQSRSAAGDSGSINEDVEGRDEGGEEGDGDSSGVSDGSQRSSSSRAD
ncbi:hypothetical protein FRC08_015199 [Ceratobasidium sp. 394]|nr:hypothetical protein FRC08_015199 [Ceratobasidium sp. 394]